jgi:hypothetical protein
MLRHAYQGTLVALQLALVFELAPRLAQGLQHDTAFGAFPQGGLAFAQGATALAAIGGGALALAFPMLALARHARSGRPRFGGLPRWAVALALAGTAVFLLGALLQVAAPLLPPDARTAATLTARPALNAGLAVMAAGVLCAELLRRSVGLPRVVAIPRAAASERIEVTQPRELATRAR